MNSKDAYWFTHDTNAKDDPKCALLIDQLGPEGYGIFWILLEILREQPDFSYPLALIPSIGRKYNTTKDKVEVVIRNYGLFEVRDEKFFYSRSLINRAIEFKERQDKRKAAALKAAVARWDREKALPERDTQGQPCDDKCDGNANAMRTQCEGNANKENKGNKRKDNIGSSLHSEPCPTENQSDAEDPSIFPETQTPVEKKPEVLSNKHCQQVVDFWNRKIAETGAQLPPAKSLSEDRKKKIRIRWLEFKKIGDPVVVCRTLFEKATASKFLQGDNPKGWSATFDWIFTNGKNWLKIYEGNYDNAAVASGGNSRIDALKNDLDYIDSFFNGKQQAGTGVDDQ